MTTAEERRKTRACCTRHRPRANGDCADCWCLEATAQQRRRMRVEVQLGEARELLGRMHGQYHAILGLTPPPKECVNACKPVATFLAGPEKGDGDE